ncbi:hypothetical protein KSP39_PZI008046 [Platanthera zijinensis]|uniref:Uncharacterized protein n=1 Tax=Platanthera zijinensis TaxID=2320716 RepID=A0AAP0G8U7_9ASPA
MMRIHSLMKLPPSNPISSASELMELIMHWRVSITSKKHCWSGGKRGRRLEMLCLEVRLQLRCQCMLRFVCHMLQIGKKEVDVIQLA